MPPHEKPVLTTSPPSTIAPLATVAERLIGTPENWPLPPIVAVAPTCALVNVGRVGSDALRFARAVNRRFETVSPNGTSPLTENQLRPAGVQHAAPSACATPEMPMLQPPLRGDATVKFVGDAETNPGGFLMFIDPDMFVRLTSKCQPFPCRCVMRLPFNAVIESSVCFLY